MFVRCAYFEGHVASADRKRFAELLRDGLATAMRGFPRVRNVRVLWSKYQESDERPIYSASA